MNRDTFKFNVNKETNVKAIEISGYANAATADRIGDLIEPKAWDLQNFKNNPIIFFNHDRDLPIGKAVKTEVTDDGLEITARISKSKEAPIPYIRDLIEEGILKTFSVGFDDHNSSYEDNEDGLTKFEKAELLEVSVVTIPMNADSVFAVKKDGALYKCKKMESLKKNWKNKSYEQVKKECLEMSGKLVAAAVNDALFHASDFVKEYVLAELDENMLNGTTKASDDFIKIAASSLNIDVKSLFELRAKEDFLEDELEEEEEDEEEMEKDANPENEDEEEEDDDEADGEIKMGEDEEEEKEEEEEEEENKSFNDCVTSKIPKLIDDGKDRDEAVAIAISQCQDQKKCDISKNDYALFIDIAEKSIEGPAVSVGPSKDSIMPENQPILELQKSQIALAGSLVENQKETNAILNSLLSAFEEIAAKMNVDQTEEDQDLEDEEEEELEELEEELEKEEISKQMIEIKRLSERLNNIMDQ